MAYPNLWYANAQGAPTQPEPVLSDVAIARLALDVGFTDPDATTMTAITLAESSGVPNVANYVPAVGLVQINLSAHPEVSFAEAIDPAFSMRYAKRLHDGRGNFCDWASFEEWCGQGYDGHYRNFLGRASSAVTLAKHGAVPPPSAPPPQTVSSGNKLEQDVRQLQDALQRLYKELKIPFPKGDVDVDDTQHTYTVRLGDTLYGVARDQLKDGEKWHEIYELNKAEIGPDPNVIAEGLVLKLPAS